MDSPSGQLHLPPLSPTLPSPSLPLWKMWRSCISLKWRPQNSAPPHPTMFLCCFSHSVLYSLLSQSKDDTANKQQVGKAQNLLCIRATWDLLVNKEEERKKIGFVQRKSSILNCYPSNWSFSFGEVAFQTLTIDFCLSPSFSSSDVFQATCSWPASLRQTCWWPSTLTL